MLACVRLTSLTTVVLLTAPLAVGCGSESDPYADDSGTDDSSGTEGTGTSTEATTDSAATTDMSTSEVTTGDGDGDPTTTTGGDCAPTPTRYVVLGDSVPAGSVGVNGKEDPQNGFKVMQQYLIDNYADSSLTYENYAVGGAQTAGVPDSQLGNIPTGMPGHVLVNIHIGGNDLAPFIFQSDQQAEDAFDPLIADGLANWQLIFDFFDDAGNFPDGTTLLVNTQYNPFDDCDATHSGISLSDLKSALLREYNETIEAEAAMHANAYVADQHPVFLGHGHIYDKPECASYIDSSAQYWMVGGFDFIHANSLGHGAMGQTFVQNANAMYGDCG